MMRRRSASFDNAGLYETQTRHGRRRMGGKLHRGREASIGAREQVQRVLYRAGCCGTDLRCFFFFLDGYRVESWQMSTNIFAAFLFFSPFF